MKHLEEPLQRNPQPADRASLSGQSAWNPVTFRWFLEQFHQPVHRYYAVHTAGNFSRAQKLTVETFALIYRHPAPAKSMFASWLFGIAWDVWNAHDHGADVVAKDTFESERLAESTHSRTLDALRSLPFYPRETVYLRFFAGLDTRSIATLMDKSEANIKLSVYQGVRQFYAHREGIASAALSAKQLQPLARAYHTYLNAALAGTSMPSVVTTDAMQATQKLIALREAVAMKPEVRAELFSQLDQTLDSGNPSTTPL